MTPLASDGCPEREPLVCQTQDVGPDGVLIEGAIGLRQEQLIELSVTLPEDPDPVQVQARVTEVGEDLSSLEFVALPRQTRRRLTGFVTEQLRRRLNIVHSLRAEEDDDWEVRDLPRPASGRPRQPVITRSAVRRARSAWTRGARA